MNKNLAVGIAFAAAALSAAIIVAVGKEGPLAENALLVPAGAIIAIYFWAKQK